MGRPRDRRSVAPAATIYWGRRSEEEKAGFLRRRRRAGEETEGKEEGIGGKVQFDSRFPFSFFFCGTRSPKESPPPLTESSIGCGRQLDQWVPPLFLPSALPPPSPPFPPSLLSLSRTRHYPLPPPSRPTRGGIKVNGARNVPPCLTDLFPCRSRPHSLPSGLIVSPHFDPPCAEGAFSLCVGQFSQIGGDVGGGWGRALPCSLERATRECHFKPPPPLPSLPCIVTRRRCW